MTEIEETELLACLLECLLHLLDAHKLNSPFDFVMRHRGKFQGFDDAVAEEMIETSGYGFAFLLALLREAIGQLSAYQLATIAHQMVGDGIEQPVGEEVVDTEGHARQEAEEGEEEGIQGDLELKVKN